MNDVERPEFSHAPIWQSSKCLDFIVIKESNLKHPDVSVVVPVYNMAEKGYLESLLNSLLNQELLSIEFVLVDDCSTDDSISMIINRVGFDPRFCIASLKVNSKQGAARNLGIELSKGRYIGFVDADDYVESNYFYYLNKYACKTNADIVVAPYQFTDAVLNAAGDPIYPIQPCERTVIEANTIRKMILHPIRIWSAIYKRRLFSDFMTRFPIDLYFEDNPTCLRLLCSSRNVTFVPAGLSDSCYLYRQHDYSTDHRLDNIWRQLNDRIITSDYLIDDAKACGYYKLDPYAIEFYYIKLALINSLSKLSLLPRSTKVEKKAEEIRDHVLQRLNTSCLLSTLAVGGLKPFLQFSFALLLPSIYVKAASTLNSKE